MDRSQAIGILIVLTALYYYVNRRWLRLPATIGVMVVAIGASALLHLLAAYGFGMEEQAFERWLRDINFNRVVLHGMLSVLLFAGALQLNVHDLLTHKWSIGVLATAGVLVSTFLIGTLTWWCLQWLGLGVSYAYCLVFGALISPTDAVVILGAMKQARVPKRLEMAITGEALFNDGAAIVVFSVLLGIATGAHPLRPGALALPFLREGGGGALLGLGFAQVARWLLKTADDKEFGVLVTLALVTGGYALADALGCSGPIAIAVAGLVLGHHGRHGTISVGTRTSIQGFWEMMDHLYNVILFALLGLESLLLTFQRASLIAGFVAIPVVLLGRFLSVGIPALLIGPFRALGTGSVGVLTWGGLRGAVSVALALSIPLGPERDSILAITYVVVVFSIVVQGLTMEHVVRRALPGEAAGD
jgi:CPA1 family monovalent cation:H+ antiporter